MTAMARRKISTRGRVLAAALCVGVTGLLAGLMAATDDTGSASAGTSSRSTVPASQPAGGSSAGSSFDGNSDTDGDGRVGDPGDSSGFPGRAPGGFDDGRSSGDSANGSSANSNGQQPSFPQPNTRSGGS
jgi:hypothetical protein